MGAAIYRGGARLSLDPRFFDHLSIPVQNAITAELVADVNAHGVLWLFRFPAYSFASFSCTSASALRTAYLFRETSRLPRKPFWEALG
jgi:hypothetical protein